MCLSPLDSKCRIRAWNRIKDIYSSSLCPASASVPEAKPSYPHPLVPSDTEHLTCPRPNASCPGPNMPSLALVTLPELREQWVTSASCYSLSPFSRPLQSGGGRGQLWRGAGIVGIFSARAQERRDGFPVLSLALRP